MRKKKKSSVTKINELADMLDDAVIFTDRAGVVKSVNAAAVRAFGENLVGQSINAVVQHSEIESVFAGTLEGENKEDLVYEPAGAVPREFKMRPRRIGNNTVAFLFLDMTLQRNLENVQRDFVANVSHELRSPLTSLAGFVETLLTEDVPDPAMRIRFLKIMEEEAQRMSRLIERPGQVFSRSQLLDLVWGHGVYVEERTVDVHLSRLRKALSKIDRNPTDLPNLIRTVRGSGYALRMP